MDTSTPEKRRGRPRGERSRNPYRAPRGERLAPSKHFSPPSFILAAHGLVSTVAWGFLVSREPDLRYVLSTLASFGFLVLSSSRFSETKQRISWRMGYTILVGASALAVGSLLDSPSAATAFNALASAALLLALLGHPGRVRSVCAGVVLALVDGALLFGLLKRHVF